MHTALTVSSWVGIRDGCTMQYRLNGRDDVEVAVCGQTQTFEFVFDVKALRQFVDLGKAALAEIDVPSNHDTASGALVVIEAS